MTSTTISKEILLHRFLKKFNSRKMDIHKWLNQFEFLVDILQVPDNEKADFLISMIDNLTRINLFKNVAPANFSDLPYEILTRKLELMYTTHCTSMLPFYRFYYRDQYYGESIEHYCFALIKLFKNCRYRKIIILLKRFINGLRNKNISKALNRISNLTFENAVCNAIVLELRRR